MRLIAALLAALAAVHTPWHAPAWFLKNALCIHSFEGAWHDNTGNSYFGGLQWLPSTWERAGGHDNPAFHHPGDRRYPFTASPREEIQRMWIVVMRQDHGSYREWGTASRCGLR